MLFSQFAMAPSQMPLLVNILFVCYSLPPSLQVTSASHMPVFQQATLSSPALYIFNGISYSVLLIFSFTWHFFHSLVFFSFSFSIHFKIILCFTVCLPEPCIQSILGQFRLKLRHTIGLDGYFMGLNFFILLSLRKLNIFRLCSHFQSSW